MTDKPVSMVAETAPVAAIMGGFEGGVYWRCADTPGMGGQDNCDRIMPYYELHGEGDVLWFAIYKGDKILARVPATVVEEVQYSD